MLRVLASVVVYGGVFGLVFGFGFGGFAVCALVHVAV